MRRDDYEAIAKRPNRIDAVVAYSVAELKPKAQRLQSAAFEEE